MIFIIVIIIIIVLIIIIIIMIINYYYYYYKTYIYIIQNDCRFWLMDKPSWWLREPSSSWFHTTGIHLCACKANLSKNSCGHMGMRCVGCPPISPRLHEIIPVTWHLEFISHHPSSPTCSPKIWYVMTKWWQIMPSYIKCFSWSNTIFGYSIPESTC